MTEKIAYKGFDKNLMCRGFQYEIGQTYKTDQKPVRCGESGFHSCENPFDVWSYYGVHESRFCVVEYGGDVKKGNDDTKLASAEITIKAELNLPDFIKTAVDYLLTATDKKRESGDYAQIGSSGYSAKIGSSGDYAKIGSSGNYAQIGSSGGSAQIGSSGGSAKIGSSGDCAQIGSSGGSAQIGSSGDCAQIGSSGDYAKIGSSGNYAQIGSSGGSAQIGSSGGSAKIGSSGDCAKIEAEGENSVIASAGVATKAKGKKGTWISLAEYKDGVCVGFATGCIGKDGLKEGVWYQAKDGNLCEAAQ